MTDPEYVFPDWPAPRRVRAASSTRIGGVSRGARASFNLATHVGDRPEDARKNREILSRGLGLPSEPYWLDQRHGAEVREARVEPELASADASYAARAGPVCVVQTADCLPVLLCSRRGEWVAAAHVGWRGVVANVARAAVRAYPGPPEDLLAWLGPAISAGRYEVDGPVRAALGEELAQAATRPSRRPGRWLMDLGAAAAWQLRWAGIERLYRFEGCVFEDRRRFYSCRRDRATGRMATLIWIE